MSHTLLEDVAQLKVDYGDRFHFILANHELSELTDFPIMKSGRMLNLLFRWRRTAVVRSTVADMRNVKRLSEDILFPGKYGCLTGRRTANQLNRRS